MTNNKWQRWNDIVCNAVMLGVVPNFSPASNFRVSAMLHKQVALGLVEKRKHGTAQSSPAEYRISNPATMRDEPAITVVVPSLDEVLQNWEEI